MEGWCDVIGEVQISSRVVLVGGLSGVCLLPCTGIRIRVLKRLYQCCCHRSISESH